MAVPNPLSELAGRALRCTIPHMPVHVGIMCKKCEKVYFPGGNTDQIDFGPSPGRLGVYRLTCAYPCNTVRLFRTYDMQPYSVSMYSYERGYAHRDEYEELRRAG
jgi:hypothetical protein